MPAAAITHASPTRTKLRTSVTAVLVNERAAVSDTHKSANDETTELKCVFKAARVEGMKGIAIKHRIDAAKMKLRMMNQNR